MKKRTWIENGYYSDGTEYIIFRTENGAYEVREYDCGEGETVFTGTYEQCVEFTQERWIAIAESLIG